MVQLIVFVSCDSPSFHTAGAPDIELTSQGLPGGKTPEVKCMLIDVGDLFSPEAALILKKDFFDSKSHI